MDENQIPEDIAGVIQECWPDGVVGEFDLGESYFHDIHPALARDLQRISGASLRWQTDTPDWQSYHVFFVSPNGDDFEFESETETTDEPDDPNAEIITAKTQGRGWYGCSVAVSLAASVASIDPSQFCEYDDDSEDQPDIETPTYDEQSGERIDIEAQYQDLLGEESFARLDAVRADIAAILDKHGLTLLDRDILDLPAPDLGVEEGIDLEPPLSVRNAFFFRGA